jgi:hypothetical protein
MKTLILLLAAAACTVSAGTRQLMVDQEKPESWSGRMVKFAPEHARKKGPCFMLYGRYPTSLIYNKKLPVSPDKTYVYKVSFRTLDAKFPASAYLGLELYDKNNRLMGFRNVSVMSLESSVVSAKKGDRFMIVKKFPSFEKIKRAAIAFNARKDYSDIPNFDVSPQTVAMKADGKDNVRIEFRAPLKKSYPAGTPIRLHSPFSPSMYYLVSGWMPAGDGKDFTVKLQGINDKPGTGREKFWKGTAYVRPFVWFGNWNRIPKAEARLLVDGLSFEEIDAPGK